MRLYEEKSIDGGVLDVDDKSRRVKVVMNKTGNLDLDKDVIDNNAYAKTITERGPKGASLMWHLTDHRASLKDAVGKPFEVLIEGNNLVFITDIPKTSWGNDVLEFYKSGAINQHSIGFRTIKSEPVNAGRSDEYRLIKEVLLYEGSAVLWGANPLTPTLTVGKSATVKERQDEYLATLKEVNNLAKLFKSGHLTDESFELVEMRLAQSTDKLKQLYDQHTQPDEKSVEPLEGESLLDVLKAFNNTLISDNDTGRKESLRAATG